MAQTRTQSSETFSEAVRVKLASIDSGLKSLNTKVDGDARQAEEEARSQLAKVNADIEANKATIAAAETQRTRWVEAQKAATSQKVAEWKASQDYGKLQERAAQAERHAAAARDVAVQALNGAHQASLEAWLAHKDASDSPKGS